MDEFVCMLCTEENKNLIPVDSAEGIQLQISTILLTHFPLCFEKPPTAGCICRCCLEKVEPFHQFYLIVVATHKSFLGHENSVNFTQKDEPFDGIKVEHEETDNTFYVDNHSGCSVSPSPLPETNGIVTEPEKRKKGRPKKIRKKLPKQKTIIPKSAGPNLQYVADELGMFRCEQCNLPFLSAWKLHKHVKEIHMALPFKCAERNCVESCATQAEVDQHFNDKHKRVKCSQCSSYVNWNRLQRHMEVSHDKEKEVLCALCGVVCKNNAALSYHRTMVHEKEPRVQCDICKRWYQHKHSLKHHFLVGHLNTPATCTICGKLFRGKHSLSRHMALHFTESREKHKCKYCERGFPSNWKLREHEASHTGLGVYECKNCAKPFRFSSSLSLHRKKCFA